MISTVAVMISTDDSISSIAVDTPIPMITAVFDWPLFMTLFEPVNEFAGMVDENSVVVSTDKNHQ